MYDTLICERPLPACFDSAFQTKSLDCELRDYRITRDGRFERRTYTDGDVWFGEAVSWEPCSYFGTVLFYNWDLNHDWHTYAVHVQDGHIVGDIREIKENT
jgi:hypothetical protein